MRKQKRRYSAMILLLAIISILAAILSGQPVMAGKSQVTFGVQ